MNMLGPKNLASRNAAKMYSTAAISIKISAIKRIFDLVVVSCINLHSSVRLFHL